MNPCVHQHIARMPRIRHRPRTYQRGGILPFLIPSAILAAKAAGTGAISGAAGYGVQKGKLDGKDY